MLSSSLLNEIDRVKVHYDGTWVGTLAMAKNGCLAFEYSSSWLAKGFSISPLSLPLEKRVFVANSQPLQGVFGVFNDSLPDGWGRLLVDRVLLKHGIDPNGVTPLARLSIVGCSGMGALEYIPQIPFSYEFGDLDLDQISEECSQILLSNYSEDLDDLFMLGGSSGGARPKILATVDDEDWIIKFPSSVDPHNIGEEEYKLALLAKRCGITFPKVRLFKSKRCSGYFGVKRFDRLIDKGLHKKVHMVSAGALLETSHRIPNLEYENLFKLTSLLQCPANSIEQLYRLMCFNVFIGNRDDHAKNFSYVYHKESGWELSPAYDLTINSGIYGEHATTVNGKGKNIALEDLVVVGVEAGIAHTKARVLAEEIQNIIQQTGKLAEF